MIVTSYVVYWGISYVLKIMKKVKVKKGYTLGTQLVLYAVQNYVDIKFDIKLFTYERWNFE